MSNVLPFPAVVTTNHRFGGCPKCGGTDGYFNIRSNHFFCCDKHNTAWCAGSNLFSGWREESPELHEANERKLRTMHIVMPVYPPSNGAA